MCARLHRLTIFFCITNQYAIGLFFVLVVSEFFGDEVPEFFVVFSFY